MLDLRTLVMRHDAWIKGKKFLESLARVATSGSYNDLANTPKIPERIGYQELSKDNISVGASQSADVDITGTITSGYSVIGVIGVSLANASSSGSGVTGIAINRFYPLSNGANVRVRNIVGSAAKIKITVRLLIRSTDRGTK